jgi:hypothetical protein
MAYHITTIINNSDRSVALTNPKSTRDAHLVPAKESYSPERPILVNQTKGDCHSVVSIALNIYTKEGNWCFWDNDPNEVYALKDGEKNPVVWLEAEAGDLTLTIDDEGKPKTTKNK